MCSMYPEDTPSYGAPLCVDISAPLDTGLQVYRLTNGVLRRLGAFTVHNARRKQQLLDEWHVLQARRLTRGATPGVGAICSKAYTRCCYGALCVGGGLQRLDCLPLVPMVATVSHLAFYLSSLDCHCWPHEPSCGLALACSSASGLSSVNGNFQTRPKVQGCISRRILLFLRCTTVSQWCVIVQTRIDMMADLASWAPPQAIADAASPAAEAPGGPQSVGAPSGPQSAAAGNGGGIGVGSGGSRAAGAAAAMDVEAAAMHRRMGRGRQL